MGTSGCGRLPGSVPAGEARESLSGRAEAGSPALHQLWAMWPRVPSPTPPTKAGSDAPPLAKSGKLENPSVVCVLGSVTAGKLAPHSQSFLGPEGTAR